ncbi:hypothetical protein FKG96_24615 [Olivibacter sp. LS-1]|nr:hypothetical protein FKG96_24615 [Olivibacter sp. LS-1]
MEKKYKTLKPYKTPYSNPITLVKGEIVRLGKEETEEKSSSLRHIFFEKINHQHNRLIRSDVFGGMRNPTVE